MTEAAPAFRTADVRVPDRVADIALRVPACTTPVTEAAPLISEADVRFPDTVAAAALRVPD